MTDNQLTQLETALIQALNDRDAAYWDWRDAVETGGDTAHAYQEWKQAQVHAFQLDQKVKSAKLSQVVDLCS
jgi:hypothetical protein